MKRFSILFVLLCASTFALAQQADIAFVAGGSFVNDSKVTFLSAPTIVDTVKTNNHVFLEGALGLRMLNARVVSLSLEVPVLGIPSQELTLSSTPSVVVDHLSTVFVTPALRVKVLPSAPISPWASIGGGWARFSTDSGATNNKAALQYGGGLDFKTGLPVLGFRAEVRDFVTGDPNFGNTNLLNGALGEGGFHRHNLMVGGGIVLKF